MFSQLKIIIVSFGVGLVVGVAGYAYFRQPASGGYVAEKTEVKTEQQARTVTRIVERPGIKETTIEKTESKQATAKQSLEVRPLKNWHLGITYIRNTNTLGLEVGRRVLGPVFLGASYNLNGTVGAFIRAEF